MIGNIGRAVKKVAKSQGDSEERGGVALIYLNIKGINII